MPMPDMAAMGRAVAIHKEKIICKALKEMGMEVDQGPRVATCAKCGKQIDGKWASDMDSFCSVACLRAWDKDPTPNKSEEPWPLAPGTLFAGSGVVMTTGSMSPFFGGSGFVSPTSNTTNSLPIDTPPTPPSGQKIQPTKSPTPIASAKDSWRKTILMWLYRMICKFSNSLSQQKPIPVRQEHT